MQNLGEVCAVDAIGDGGIEFADLLLVLPQRVAQPFWMWIVTTVGRVVRELRHDLGAPVGWETAHERDGSTQIFARLFGQFGIEPSPVELVVDLQPGVDTAAQR